MSLPSSFLYLKTGINNNKKQKTFENVLKFPEGNLESIVSTVEGERRRDEEEVFRKNGQQIFGKQREWRQLEGVEEEEQRRMRRMRKNSKKRKEKIYSKRQ